MHAFVVHADADADLDALWEQDEKTAADVTVLIEEISGDEALLKAMHVHQFSQGRIHVSRLFKFEIWGKSIWRIRFTSLADHNRLIPYRLIYACHGDYIHLLAVMHRDREYEQDSLLLARIKAACRGLGIPTPQ